MSNLANCDAPYFRFFISKTFALLFSGNSSRENKQKKKKMSNPHEKNTRKLHDKTKQKKRSSDIQKKRPKSPLCCQNDSNNLNKDTTQQKPYKWDVIESKPTPSKKSTSCASSSHTDTTETSSSSSAQNSPIPVRLRSRTRSPRRPQKQESKTEDKHEQSQPERKHKNEHKQSKSESETEHKHKQNTNPQQDLKSVEKQSENEHVLNYTQQNAQNWLEKKISEQRTAQKTNKDREISSLDQTSFALRTPQKFGCLYLDEKNNKVHIRMHQIVPNFTTNEQRRTQIYYNNNPQYHHFHTHNYVNPTKETFYRCPSPLCHHGIINTTNISKHVKAHCSLFHKQTPLIYEYKENNEWIEIEYKPSTPTKQHLK